MENWVGATTTVALHSGCKLKMAAVQFFLRRTRHFDKLLHRPCLLGHKIALNTRCLSQGHKHKLKLEDRTFVKVRFLQLLMRKPSNELSSCLCFVRVRKSHSM